MFSAGPCFILFFLVGSFDFFCCISSLFAFAENGPWGLVQRHGVIEEFAKLNNFDGATIKVWFNNKRQRDTGEPSEP